MPDSHELDRLIKSLQDAFKELDRNHNDTIRLVLQLRNCIREALRALEIFENQSFAVVELHKALDLIGDI